MSRWLLLALCSVGLMGAVVYTEPLRPPGARGLGGICERDRDCQLGLECAQIEGVIEAQCAASCNSTAACQEQFGTDSVCLGADLCARTCGPASPCPGGAFCNAFGWCERLAD